MLNVRHISNADIDDLYWLRKCVICFAPHDENFREVWSWHDLLLPSYSILAADTFRDLDLW